MFYLIIPNFDMCQPSSDLPDSFINRNVPATARDVSDLRFTSTDVGDAPTALQLLITQEQRET